VDVLPTVLGLTGVSGPDDMDGIDLSMRLRGEEGPDPESTYIMDVCAAGEALHAGVPEWRGVRTKTHTYAATHDGGWLLYDNERDPYQRHNLIDHPGSRELRASLEAMVDRTTWRSPSGPARRPAHRGSRASPWTICGRA